MTRMIVSRVAWFAPILLLSTLLIFILVELSPGDPAVSYFGTAVSAELREQFAQKFGLNDPLWVKYFRFIGDVVRGEFGRSLANQTEISGMLRTGIPITLQLTSLSLGFGLCFGTIAGIISAVRRGGVADHIIRVASNLAVAAPSFWIGLVLVSFVAVGWGLLPTGGYVPFSEDPADWAKHLILPVLSMGLPLTGIFARIVRTSVVEELDKPYVRTAYGSGLPPQVVIGRNVLRNALLSPITVLGIYFGWLLAGAVLVEMIFSLPGLGRLLVTGVLQVDLNVIRSVALVTVLMFLIANLIVDVLYILLNPRIRG